MNINQYHPKKEPQTILTSLRPNRQYIKIDLLWISSAKVTNFGLPKSMTSVPEAPIHKFDGFRIESGRIFEGQIFTFPNLTHNFYWFHMSS
jgi:hypothetical protein